jgi:hypothetical protein
VQAAAQRITLYPRGADLRLFDKDAGRRPDAAA